MLIKINGQEKEVLEGVTIKTLLDELGIAPRGIAVEVNRVIVFKSAFSSTRLAPGDAVEIIRMVGGG